MSKKLTKSQLEKIINNPLIPDFAKKDAKSRLDKGDYSDAPKKEVNIFKTGSQAEKRLKDEKKKVDITEVNNKLQKLIQASGVKDVQMKADDLSRSGSDTMIIDIYGKNKNMAGMQIIVEDGVYEVSEYGAGIKGEDLLIFGEYKTLEAAVKQALKGNYTSGGQKPKKVLEGSDGTGDELYKPFDKYKKEQDAKKDAEKPRMTESEEKKSFKSLIPVKEIEIEWHEGTGEFDGKKTKSWDKFQEMLLKIYNDFEGGGYNKTKVKITWEGGQEIVDRIDIGNNEGDFNPKKQEIGAYLKPLKGVMYNSNLQVGDREKLSWSDKDVAPAKKPSSGIPKPKFKKGDYVHFRTNEISDLINAEKWDEVKRLHKWYEVTDVITSRGEIQYSLRGESVNTLESNLRPQTGLEYYKSKKESSWIDVLNSNNLHEAEQNYRHFVIGKLTPLQVLGRLSGYKNPKKAASNYLKEQIIIQESGKDLVRKLISDKLIKKPVSSTKEKTPEKTEDSHISDCKKALEKAQYSVVKKKTPSGRKQVRVKRQDRTILNTKMESVFKTIEKDVPKEKEDVKKDVLNSLGNISKVLTKIVQALDKAAKNGEIETIKKVEKLLEKL